VAEKTKKKIKFTVDWEVWNSYDPHYKWDASSYIDEPTHYLLDLLRRHDIKAIFYCVGWLKDNRADLYKSIQADGHVLGDHTYFHNGRTTFSPSREPRWKGEKRLFSGGFWFRLMPYWWIKKEVEKEGIFFIHPHDVLLEHPKCGLRTFDRNIGLKTSRDKLERLVRELDWA
jgi:hypothetical protein